MKQIYVLDERFFLFESVTKEVACISFRRAVCSSINPSPANQEDVRSLLFHFNVLPLNIFAIVEHQSTVCQTRTRK